MNNRSFSKILILIVLVGLVAGGFLIYRYLLVPKEEAKTTEEVKKTEEVTKDEIADWKTYRNQEYDFEIKYPKDWYIKVEAYPTSPGQKPGVTKLGVSFENYPSGEGRGKEDWRLILLWVEEISITKWLDTMKEAKGNIEETTIDSLKGYKAVNPVGIYAVVAKDKYVYGLMAFFPDVITEKIFNQMFSTFRFIK
jgi:hypothetical protein